MAGAKSQKMELSDGELSDDGGGEDLDTSVCKTCNMTFTNSKAFYHHIYSVSHLQRTSNLASSSEPPLAPAVAAKSSFPMEALYVSKPLPLSSEAAHRDAHKPLPLSSEAAHRDAHKPLPLLSEAAHHDTYKPLPLSSEAAHHDAHKLLPLSSEAAHRDAYKPLPLSAEAAHDAYKSLPLSSEAAHRDMYKPLPLSSEAACDMYDDISYDMQSPQWPQFEPLCEGQWVMGNKKSEETGMIYSCEMCAVSYKEKLMIDLHLAGLRHMKNVEATEDESSVVESDCNKRSLNDRIERNVDLFKQLDVCPELEQIAAKSETAEAQEKKLKVTDILSRNFSAFQKFFFTQVYDDDNADDDVEPVLGVDYVSEFRFSSDRVEYVCNLCEDSLTAPVCLTEHASSLRHLLRFIFHHDSSSFKMISLADKCADLKYVRNVAADIESKQGRQLRTRVFVETPSSPSGEGDLYTETDSASSQWLEQKDDLIQPISALPGHSANATYTFKRPPDETTRVTDMQALLDTLAYQSCVASGKPPGLVKPVSRMDLLSSLAAFDITNDNDAEVSLQIANALTLALLSCRMKMVPVLKSSDRAKLEPKLVKLQEEAELVAEKTRVRHIAPDQDSVLP